MAGSSPSSTLGGAYAETLISLANTAGIAPVGLSSAVSTPRDVVALTDPQTVREFVDARWHSRVSRVSGGQADAAAARLGPVRLLGMYARKGPQTRLSFAEVAFARDWIPTTVEVFESLTASGGVGTYRLVGCVPVGTELLATPSELTRWAWQCGLAVDGLARVIGIWNHPRVASGVIDDHTVRFILADLYCEGVDIRYVVAPQVGERIVRLSPKMAAYAVALDSRLATLAANYSKPPGIRPLMEWYDLVLKSVVREGSVDETATRYQHALGPIVEAMTMIGTGDDESLARCRKYLAYIDPVTTPIDRVRGLVVRYVLDHVKLSTTELWWVLGNAWQYNAWLMDSFVANPANSRQAVAMAKKMGAGVIVATACTGDLATPGDERGGDSLAHPERYRWLLNVLGTDERAPALVRRTLSHTESNRALLAIVVEAAAHEFSKASKPVQARLWKALASEDSLFGGRDPKSFAEVTDIYMAREAEAAARVAAREGGRK